MGTEQAVAAEGLGKRFGPVRALAGVDLAVPASGVLGLLGPNGAGKTTLVRILATLLRPDQGRARVCGLDVTRQPDQVRRLVGLSGQYAAVDAFLTGRENLRMVGRLAGLPTSCWSASTSARRPAGWRGPTPAGCAAAWTSPPAWWPGRRWCSWTSPPPAWTRAAASACGGCSAS